MPIKRVNDKRVKLIDMEGVQEEHEGKQTNDI